MTRFGPYEIVAPLGAGGMGEVYRARDTRLDRDVAIKVSATEFSERFAREARSIAALNHSNICHLYDVGPDYLVLEYVEGVHPAGPMTFDDALPIIRQLIDGIEAAHDANIIHRDLKAANIKITSDGVVKILDFGLAKSADAEPSVDLANSPTFTMGATQAGVIVGTAAYMAPEQARGKTADRRSDVWSFGVVVYELLVGRTPFEGESAVEILGAVLNKEPDWTPVPPRARRLLRWCLQKDRRKRLAAIADARSLLDEDDSAAAPAPATSAKGSRLWAVVAAALALVATGFAFSWWSARQPVDRPLTRLSVDLGPRAVRGARITAVLSPDGSRLVFTGQDEQVSSGVLRLFVRRLDQPNATPLAGTGAGTLETPFFSPDGKWLGYFGNGVLTKVALDGGSPVEIAPFDGSAGGAWEENGSILVGSVAGLIEVSPVGAMRRIIDGTAAFPDVLPGGRAAVYDAVSQPRISNLDDLDVAVVDLQTHRTKTLVRSGYWPRYLPTSAKTGHLVFIRGGTLFGVAFDPTRLEISGTPAPLITDIAASPSITSGGGQFTFASNGTFVYLSGVTQSRGYPIEWLDAKGAVMPLLAQANAYGAPRLSPDGTRLAYQLSNGSGSDVWVDDLARDTPTQLTFTHPPSLELAWAPDSKHLVFSGGDALWWLSADGSGEPVLLLKGLNARPTSVAPDGRLAFIQSERARPTIWTAPVDASDPDHPTAGTPKPFLPQSTSIQADPAFSPDGKFLAYASSESGREEIFVKPFPGPGGKWKISTAGGKFPAWSRTTRELFWLGGDDRIMVADYRVQADTLIAGRPRVWSSTPIRRDGVRQNFDMSADSTRAVIFPAAAATDERTLHATFLLNFFDEVRRRIPR